MKIRRLSIKNIRAFESLEWRPPDPNKNWNVILGDNGSGKSTLLRSLSLVLVGPRQALATRQEWSTWLRRGTKAAEIAVDILPDSDFDKFSKKGKVGNYRALPASITIAVGSDGSVTPPEKTPGLKPLSPDRHVWGDGDGWFSAAYGPFRRFSGGDKDADRIFLSNPILGAHISVFGENVALSECLLWLQELNYKTLEKDEESAELLERLKAFINQPDFLPNGVCLTKITSKAVEFEDSNGCPIAVEDLSDGFRSILSMTFELIRQLDQYAAPKDVFSEDMTRIILPGVVLIDEVDAHLHPNWQKEIGFWLTKHFPRIQFVVTTHSPLVCHAAKNGSIFHLPMPGADKMPRFIEGAELDRLLYGDILDGISTSAFGVESTRSKEANSLQARLADLNLAELIRDLTQAESAEQQQLRTIFATDAGLVPKRNDDSNS